MFGGIGENLLDRPAVVFDERLLEKAVLRIEFINLAFDDFLNNIRGLALYLFCENGLFPLYGLRINLIFIKRQGLGCGYVHCNVGGSLL